MASATASTVSFSAAATTARTSTSRLPTCVHAFARSTVRPAGFRLHHNRPNLAKAVNSGCWGSAGNCGPSMNYRRWASGPNMQRSFNKWAEQASNNMWFPVDVEETAQQYTFVADVPGLGKNDIKVLLLPVLLVKASLVILLLACVLECHTAAFAHLHAKPCVLNLLCCMLNQ